MEIKKLGIKTSKLEKYRKLLKECYKYSKNSDHPSTHNAALLVDKDKIVLKGANMFPPKVKHSKYRLEKGNRNVYINHAERDLIYKAAAKGLKTKGLTMVMPWLPCIPCATSIITSGVKKLICHKQMIERTSDRWIKELKEAVKFMEEAGIKIIAYDGKVGVKAQMHTKIWNA